MAHIPDGVVSLPVLIVGAAVTVGGCAIGLRRLTPERIPRTALLAAAFFVASLIHVPLGPSSVHLLLCGLVGMVLGWAAFPAIAVALMLQAVMFGFGGIAVLGVNAMNMAVPAVLCGGVFGRARRRWNDPRQLALAGGVCGALGVVLTALAVAATLAASGRAFVPAARLVVLAHLPVAAVEAAIGAAVVGFVARVRPDLIGVRAELAGEPG